MKRFTVWLFWRVWYVGRMRPRPGPKSLEIWCTRAIRCRWPWKKFNPHIWHNDDGKMWEVWLSDEQCYGESRRMTLDVLIGRDSGDIVGLKLYDSDLRGGDK